MSFNVGRDFAPDVSNEDYWYECECYLRDHEGFLRFEHVATKSAF